MRPSDTLLLDLFTPDPSSRLLLLEGGNGALARELATRVPQGEVLTLSRDIREVREARERLAGSPNAATSEQVLPEKGEPWDVAILTMPKGRRYARALLLAAWRALRPGGQLLVAGPSQEGVKAVITDAKRLFGSAAILGYRNHQRVASSVRGQNLPDPLPTEFAEPGIAPGTTRRIEIERPEGLLSIDSHPGIFSWNDLDQGTALLLDHLHVQRDERVWDVGCGAGIIGLAAAMADSSVTMSDVNLLALRYARANAEMNGLDDRVAIFPADGLEGSTGAWDLIVSNPPFHQGKAVDTSMPDALIERAAEILVPGGRLLLVANRFLAYHHAMERHFARVTRLAETPKFHVLEARP